MEHKLKVLVLAGGNSSERAVSLTSARAVTEALQRNGYSVMAIDSASGQTLLDDSGRFMLKADDKSLSKLGVEAPQSLVISKTLDKKEYKNIDLVFIALHGGAGEDGTIQAILDLAGIKYTGSRMLASALAMNKAMSKKLAVSENIPTPKWLLFEKGKLKSVDPTRQILREFPLPLIVKPNNSGSTVGLTLVKEAARIKPALETAFKEGIQAVVEQYIKGREVTCSVLNGTPLPIVEIIPKNELYDYQCKYTKGMSQYICPAEIDEKVADLIMKYAARMYEQIGCRGLARVDFILDKDNKPWFLEVNTIPGMTELSLAPMAAKASGIDFDELIRRICTASMEEKENEE